MAKWVRQFRGPRSSGPHRVACKALYRALLELCPRIPLPTTLPSQGDVNPIKHLIRKGFRRHNYDYSPRLAVKALKVGYNAEELLRAAASGSQPAISQIHNFLHHLHVQRQESKQPPAPQRERPRLSEYPNSPKVLESRPLPVEKLSGRRGIPILAHASGFPFLRFKKPQSSFLSRVLRNKLDQRHNLFERIKELDGVQTKLAAWEDQWDQYVQLQLERECVNKKMWRNREALDWQGGWMREVLGARRDVWRRLEEGYTKAQAMADKMMQIVDSEKKLLEKEKWERSQAKRIERMRKKEEALKGAHIPEKRDLN